MEKSNKKPPCARIIKTKEDNVTIIHIFGLDDHPEAYKRTYQEILSEIRKNMMRIVAAGEAEPVIRAFPSLEIH